MVMYSIERNIVKLENKNYKPISDKNRKDIEVHFLKLKEYEYDYVYNSKHFNSIEKKLKKMISAVKLTKDINNNLVVCIFETHRKHFAIVSYNVTFIPGPVVKKICYVNNNHEILMYLFKLESEMKLNTKKSSLARYPSSFFKNYKETINYFNLNTPVDQDHS